MKKLLLCSFLFQTGIASATSVPTIDFSLSPSVGKCEDFSGSWVGLCTEIHSKSKKSNVKDYSLHINQDSCKTIRFNGEVNHEIGVTTNSNNSNSLGNKFFLSKILWNEEGGLNFYKHKSIDKYHEYYGQVRKHGTIKKNSDDSLTLWYSKKVMKKNHDSEEYNNVSVQTKCELDRLK